jgi:TP53 regulating kinase and related kinases
LARVLLSKGAEADIYETTWYGNKAISKVRIEKPYRQKLLDYEIRKYRTVREATMLSIVKGTGVRTPFVYFVDPIATEIVMEFIEGESLKEKLNPDLALQMGKCAGLLHINNIIHSDLTTSNFINAKEKGIVMLDFGLAFFSERLEDKAVDIRLVKEVLYSSYVSICAKVFSEFLKGYSSIVGKRITATLRKVREIELRGRYARTM